MARNITSSAVQNVVWGVGIDAPANGTTTLNQHAYSGLFSVNFFVSLLFQNL